MNGNEDIAVRPGIDWNFPAGYGYGNAETRTVKLAEIEWIQSVKSTTGYIESLIATVEQIGATCDRDLRRAHAHVVAPLVQLHISYGTFAGKV